MSGTMALKEENLLLDESAVDALLRNIDVNMELNNLDFSSIVTPPSLTLTDEATLDVEYQVPIVLPERLGPPERGDFAGPYNFEVQVNSNDMHKKKYVFSSKLKRIYVNMNVDFNVHFAWSYHLSPQPMFVRAMVVFSDDTQAGKRVHRCLQHKHGSENGVDASIREHVLRSTRDINSRDVHYSGNPEITESWLSVLVKFPPVPDQSTQAYSHQYQFVCKNSCNSGINRRSIELLFTLEDAFGKIYGRSTLGTRVCSCPRRDMIRDEDAEGAYLPGKKRVPSNKIDQPESKKVKIETVVVDDDDDVVVLPAGLQIIGKKTLTTGLTVCLNMMEQAASYKTHDAQATDKYRKAIAELKKFIDDNH